VSEVAPSFVVRTVPVDVVRPVRHRVLRDGWPESSVHTPLDDSPATWHLAAMAGDEAVGVVTVFPEAYPARPDLTAERFRWMAVLPAWQGAGVGGALMRRAAEIAFEHGAELLWAHGRDSAQGFYKGMGFRVEGDGFIDEVTGLGHHLVVIAIEKLRA
jgi:GNAT superfamily N-acetyltransferase